jgi:predicted AlkP superfamily pyrophosphatase or phosphodiesterase
MNNYTDTQYIEGLKARSPQVTRDFFYQLCNYTLNDIRHSMMKDHVEYDDLVNELFLYLSQHDWHRLDTFSAINECHLSTWIIKVSWRFFWKQRHRLLGYDNCDMDTNGIKESETDSPDIDIIMDVKQTLDDMPNRRYADLLRKMLLEGHDAEEMAMLYHTTEANIYNIKHRAILMFIKIYVSRK